MSKPRPAICLLTHCKAQRDGVHPLEACAQMQQWCDDCKKSVSNFVPFLQEQGLLKKKKSRGRTKKQQQQLEG